MFRHFATACAALCLITAASAARAEDPLISEHCLGNASETCFIIVEGQIEAGLTDQLRAFIGNGRDARRVVLNSPGGNLGEALKLGRYLREADLDTSIGSSAAMTRDADGRLAPMTLAAAGPGRCESACAYAFMGGVRRALREDDVLGLHRFHAPGQTIDGDSAQQLSGMLISYMVEMGIDARIFTLASLQGSDQMHHVTVTEAEAYDVTTPFGYAPVFLEPYKDGLIASAKRLDTVSAYSGVDQVTFFCRGGQPLVLFHAALHALEETSPGTFEAEIDGTFVSLPGDSLTIRPNGEEAFITATVTPEIAQGIAGASDIWLSASFARVIGGNYAAWMQPSPMDRRMIASAFRFCID